MLRIVLTELEHDHQRFDRERDDEHHHEAREKAAHARGRAHVRFPLRFLFQYRLAQLERRDRNGENGYALQNREQAVGGQIAAGLQPSQSCAAAKPISPSALAMNNRLMTKWPTGKMP